MSLLAQAPAPYPTHRLRCSVESFDGSKLVMKERSGQVMRLALVDNFSVSEVTPVTLSSIQGGGFIGTAAMAGSDGKSRALEVLVFPDSARGTGEGHGPSDLQPGSTMTNATVCDMVVASGGRTLKLRYKDGEKTIVVPAGLPIVTLHPGDRSLLVPGATLLVPVQTRDGKPAALRAAVGRDGFTPPMQAWQ